jgi:hypothetical protein
MDSNHGSRYSHNSPIKGTCGLVGSGSGERANVIIVASDLLTVPNSDEADQRIGSISFIGFTPRARANATMLIRLTLRSPRSTAPT